ncbi:MAG: hypothetical protein ACM3SY_16590 [Candidatus Omnitrophota bacterium]
MKSTKSINVYLFVLVLIMGFGINAHARMALNDTFDGFLNPQRSLIEPLVTNGAGDFMASYAEALLMLKEYEIAPEAPFNYNNAALKIASAIKHLEAARQKYSDAVQFSENCGYEEVHKLKLNNYDYSTRILRDGLNTTIATDVVNVMRPANVHGLYQKFLGKIDAIMPVLKSMQSSLNGNAMPEVPLAWKLIQKYSEALLFGNYATVFSQTAFQPLHVVKK